MKQRQLIEQVCIILLRERYTVKSLARSCFDIVARQGCRILLVKAVEDANTLNKESVDEMLRVADYLNAVPLITAEKAGFVLEKNVVYLRYGVYTLNIETFENSVRNKIPFIKSSKAGHTVQLDSASLRQKREELGLSLNELAAKIGVSRKMIQKYERGDTEITLQKAVRMYDCIGNSVFKRINVFSKRRAAPAAAKGKKRDVTQKYSDLGFRADDLHRSPFDVMAKKEEEIILTSVGDKANPHIEKVSELLEADRLMIYKKKKPKDVPSMKKKEFLELEKAKALIKFLKEF